MVTKVVSVCLLFLGSVAANAQCPGGVCPTGATAHSRGQYSYPGDVYTHLMVDHGINAAGMSLYEAESLHSRLHRESKSGSAVNVVRGLADAALAPGRYVRNRQPVKSFFQRVLRRS